MTPSTEQQEIGELIRTKRKEKNITQNELGKKLGISKVAILSYEKGKVKVIPYEKRVKLSKILNISLDELLYTFENPFDDICPYIEEDTAANKTDNDTISQTLKKTEKNTVSNKFDYDTISQTLKNYDIMLVKSSNGAYSLVCNSTGETFSIPPDEVKSVTHLLELAKREVAPFVFLRIKSGLQNIQEINDFLSPILHPRRYPVYDTDQNTKK